MIVYRCLKSDEILGMINNKKYDHNTIYGQNTFHYEKDCFYKHFFVFAQHTKNYAVGDIIGEYIIPNDIIYEYGFGFYSGVKTMRNNKLFNWYIPLPEIIIREEDFRNEYLHSVNKELNGWLEQKKLYPNDNIKYNEPVEEYFKGNPNLMGYTDYSYSDIYYEMVYQLAIKNDMNLNKVAYLLKNVDLHNEIKKYFENNIDFFHNQTNEYIKSKKVVINS